MKSNDKKDKAMKKSIVYRNKKGQWTSKKEEAVQVYERSGRNFTKIIDKLTKASNKDFTRPAPVIKEVSPDDIQVFTPEQGDKYNIYEIRERELEKHRLEAEKKLKEEFVYSHLVEEKFGLTENEQKQNYELLKAANARIDTLNEQIKLSDDDMLAKFRYNQNVDPLALARRLTRAEEVLSESFLDVYANKYKTDFLENYKHHISGVASTEGKDLYEELTNAIDKLSPIEFFQLLKITDSSSLAYSLDSKRDRYGIEMILMEIENMVNIINDRVNRGRW